MSQNIRCPSCGEADNKVYNTRPIQDQYVVWRRRRCLECGNRWTTEEVSKKHEPLVELPVDWDNLKPEQRRILTRIIHDFARDNQRKENGHDVRPGV